MKYYCLQFNDDVREVGKQPQAPDVKMIAYNTMDLGQEGPIKVPLVPPQPILQRKAKPTTILNVVAINSTKFIVCKGCFIKFLDKFKLGTYKFWPIKVYQNENLLNEYYLFHLDYPDDSKIVNFQKSEFFIGKIDDWRYRGDSIKISDFTNYIATKEVLKNEGLSVKINKLTIDFSKLKNNNDLLRLSVVSLFRGYLVSEKLKKNIEEQHFTGMVFKEIEEMDKRIQVIY